MIHLHAVISKESDWENGRPWWTISELFRVQSLRLRLGVPVDLGTVFAETQFFGNSSARTEEHALVLLEPFEIDRGI
jgi:hypothetical protein